MSKILKKISASLILILMLFSVAFNVLDYEYKVYAAGSDNVEIISNNSKFKLIISQETYNKYSYIQWKNWLSRYDDYYDILSSFTKISTSQITIDASNNTIEYNNGSENISSDAILAITAGANIKYRKSEFEKEVEDLLNNTTQKIESQVLLHELGHVFEHKGNTYYDWVIQPEVMAEVLANYAYNNSNIDILSISILNGGRTTRTSYENYLSTFSNPYYSEYYWLALKIINIQKNYGSLSSTLQALSTSEYGKNYSYKFNILIDTWSEIRGTDIWTQFTDSDISRISSILGGTIGTLKQLETKVTNISVKGDKSRKEGTIDYTQNDTKATITVTVESKKQPKSVTIRLGDKEQITTAPIINGDTYMYTTIVDVSTLATQEKLEADPTVYVTVIDANGNKTDEFTQKVTIEIEEVSVEIKSISVTGNNTKEENKLNLDKDEKINIKVKIEIIPQEKIDSVKITIGNQTYNLKDYTTSNSIKTYTGNLTLTEEVKERNKKQ